MPNRKLTRDNKNDGRNEILGKARNKIGTKKIIIWGSNGELNGIFVKYSKENINPI